MNPIMSRCARAIYRLKAGVVCFALGAGALNAHAFLLGDYPASPTQVIEYYNTQLGHYFYTILPSEISAIDAGAAGPGWVKTGLTFEAFESIAASYSAGYPTCDKESDPCMPIFRFYGTPGLGPNSHFYTGSAAEAAGLEQPGTGWSFEAIAFYLPLPDPATGKCRSGYPVERFYNNRYASNDATHRYTASADAAAQMRAAGWIDEGVAFCTYQQAIASIEAYRVESTAETQITDPATCDTSTATGRSCIAISNLPFPRTPFPPLDAMSANADPFTAATWIYYSGLPGYSFYALPYATRDEAAKDVFVVTGDQRSAAFGVHVATTQKGPSAYSSISLMRRLPDMAGAQDGRFFPFRKRYGTNYALWASLGGGPGSPIMSALPGSAAYTVWTLEYEDSVSGHVFRANVLMAGTIQAGNGFVARDAKDGVPIVAAGGSSSSYGTATGGFPLPVSAGSGSMLLTFWSVTPGQFAATVAAARTIDAVLSSDPADYLVRSFGMVNEVYGSGEIGTHFGSIRIDLVPVK